MIYSLVRKVFKIYLTLHSKAYMYFIGTKANLLGLVLVRLRGNDVILMRMGEYLLTQEVLKMTNFIKEQDEVVKACP